MKCDKCGQECCEHPDSKLFLQKSCGDINLFCNVCEHDFGPVRELISAKSDAWRYAREIEKGCALESDLRAQVATLTRERDEARAERSVAIKHTSDWRIAADSARARIAELEDSLRETNTERVNGLTRLNEARILIAKLEATVELLRNRITELGAATESKLPDDLIVHANGTWEWRKV